MLNIFKTHLSDNGVLYYNTTSSKRVIATALSIFRNLLGIGNFIACSNHPINFNIKSYKQTLIDFKIDNRKIFNETMLSFKRLVNTVENLKNQGLANNHYPFKTYNQLVKEAKNAPIITDDNMGHEWVY